MNAIATNVRSLKIRKRSSERELNPMERWNGGILGTENGERAPFGSGVLRLRIAEFILRDEGPEARGKEFSAFRFKSAAGGCYSNLF
jgi:hypothetical protein